nr:G0/G1 switch protein 2 [Solea senegalensis]
METMQEFIPFAKEMLSQKPRRGLLKIYLLGTAFAVLGSIIGLLETMCHPFSTGQPLDAELLLMLEQRTVQVETQHMVERQEEEVEKKEEKELAHENGAITETMTLSNNQRPSYRSIATRLHAS